MCGIFGLVSRRGISCSPRKAKELLQAFYSLSESRGKEASGAALLVGDRIDVVKAAVRGRDFLDLAEAEVILDGFAGALRSASPFALIGHTRMVTNGGDHVPGNNQPVIRDGLVAVHNGIIVNEARIWANIPDIERHLEVDTEAFLALASRRLAHGTDLSSTVALSMTDLEGANSIALMSASHDDLVLSTANGSMFVWQGGEGDLVAFASEKAILEEVAHTALQPFFSVGPKNIEQVNPGELVRLSLNGKELFRGRWTDADLPASVRRAAARTLVDHPVESCPRRPPPMSINTSRCAEIAGTLTIDWEAIRAQKRCVRCVLPETFPFIRFDSSGVCNFCRNHKPYPYKGREQLQRELAAVKSVTGAPDVLFPISGGRDSCYGLHVVVREMGAKPVAFTYDWGMVTDLARRNISRMCGALGIEHVLVSADIRQKRDFIRKNVAAWLRKPHLGTVPLFMAGDKQFFYYANMLRQEMGLANTLFSMNPLERTDFKVGFCGIDESYHKERHYDPKFMNKLRLGGFYGKEFLRNLAFFNSSLLDSAFAYFSYYLIPKNFTSMYDYLPWHEREVEEVLLRQYDWEMSPDTKSTWRIGDGTAAFYNYIYLRVAGFSENDTFRSNQIREGLISREDAIDRIYVDNEPRDQSIAWYFDTIGLDAVEALKTINRMPTRYAVAGNP